MLSRGFIIFVVLPFRDSYFTERGTLRSSSRARKVVLNFARILARKVSDQLARPQGASISRSL